MLQILPQFRYLKPQIHAPFRILMGRQAAGAVMRHVAATLPVGSPCEAGGLLAVVTLAQCVLYTEYSCTNRIRALAPSSGHS